MHRAPALKPESGETEVFAPDGSKTGTARRRTRMLVPVLLRHSQTPVIKRQSAVLVLTDYASASLAHRSLALK